MSAVVPSAVAGIGQVGAVKAKRGRKRKTDGAAGVQPQGTVKARKRAKVSDPPEEVIGADGLSAIVVEALGLDADGSDELDILDYDVLNENTHSEE